LAPVHVEDALREPPADYEVLETTKRIFVGGAAFNRVTGKRLIGLYNYTDREFDFDKLAGENWMPWLIEQKSV